MKMLENRMVIDSPVVEKKSRGPGYRSVDMRIFVPKEDVFEYAVENVSLNENLKREFLDWFYLNWIKED